MSEDVWKTLLIWMEGAKRGVFEVSKTTYMLVTTATSPPDSAMSKLREGASEADVNASYDLLKTAAQDSANSATEGAGSAFLEMTADEAKLLLSRVVVIDNHPNLTDVFSDIVAGFNILAPTNAELAAQYLEGWWLNRVGQHLIGEDDAGIPVQHLILKAHEIGKTLTDEALPIDNPETLDIKEYSDDDETRVFVRQMRAIKITDGMVRGATSDFYRAYAQRSRWARESLILEDELSNYEEKLRDAWRRKFDMSLRMKTKKKGFASRRVSCNTQDRRRFETWSRSGSPQVHIIGLLIDTKSGGIQILTVLTGRYRRQAMDRAWQDRPREEAYAFNPAFLSSLVCDFVREFTKAKHEACPVTLAFLAPALSLHRQTRTRFPSRTVTSLYEWLQNNEDVLVDLPRRNHALLPLLRDGLKFAVYQKVIEFSDGHPCCWTKKRAFHSRIIGNGVQRHERGCGRHKVLGKVVCQVWL